MKGLCGTVFLNACKSYVRHKVISFHFAQKHIHEKHMHSTLAEQENLDRIERNPPH